MTLPHDRHGFLVGQPIGDDEAERLLAGIKGDTSKILAAMRQLHSSAAGARPSSMRAAAMRSVGGPVASPAGRAAASALRVRDAGGRYLASLASSSRSGAGATDVAQAAQSLARTAESQRRDAKADKAAQPRGNDGRFGKGGKGGGVGLGGRLGGAMPIGGDALAGTERVDPLLGAIGEIRGAVSAVAVPLGRAGSMAFGSRGVGTEDKPQVAWMRRMWRELRGLRTDENKANRETVRSIKGIKPGAARSGGGLLPDLLSKLPGLSDLVPFAAGTGFAAVAVQALKAAKGLAKRLPVIGAVLEVFDGALEDYKIAGDGRLSDDEKRQRRAENAGGTAGAIGGGLAGFAAGQALIPVPVVGGLIGAAVGAWLGNEGGKRAGGAASSLFGPKYAASKDTLTDASNRAGVDPNIVSAIAAKESGFDPSARPMRRDGTLMSSAHGLGQMLDGTWADTMRKHGEKYGVAGAAQMTKDQLLAPNLRDDPRLQASMLAELTGENAAAARRSTGKNDPAGVYAMHTLGAGDGAKFLKAYAANPNAPVSDVLSPNVIGNNPSLYGGSLGDSYAALSRAMAVNSNGGPAVPALPQRSAMVAPGAPPAVDVGASRVGSAPAAAAPAPAAPAAGQDVRDRTIAHIVTGGIGGSSLLHRW